MKLLNPVLTLPLFIFFISCDKMDSPPGNHNSYTETPPPAPVTTALGVYAYNNIQSNNPLQLFGTNNGNNTDLGYQATYDGFFNNGVTMDRFNSHLAYRTTIVANDLGFLQYKSFSAIGSNKNYVGFKFLNFTNAGGVQNLNGPVTLNLPGNGTLTFPQYSFNSLSIDERYDFYVNYLVPSAQDYAVSLPALPIGDDNGKRYFLDSYGLYQIRPILIYCNCNIISSYDFFEKEVTLRIPVTNDRISSAPDSVEAWHLNALTLQWEKNGYAYKTDGFYEKKIRQHGVWNFAKPRDAVYLVIQLRTTNDMAIPNTRYIVRSGSDEIAEGRTDEEGNALALVPAGKLLSFNIINDHFYNYSNLQLPDQNIGSFSEAAIQKIIMPDRTDISTLEGTVYNCDGTFFGNGSVLVSQRDAKDVYEVPISNGKFFTANWINVASGDSKLTFRDAAGNTAFEVNTWLGSEYISHLKRLKENFYACPDAPQLYCNLQLDNVSSAITGNVNQSTPMLTAKPVPGSTEITIQNGNKGVSFSMWILGGPTGVISGDPLKVNNEDCRLDPNGSSELTIYRNDATINGFMEGWFAIDYLDGNDLPHKASGNFRIKIIN